MDWGALSSNPNAILTQKEITELNKQEKINTMNSIMKKILGDDMAEYIEIHLKNRYKYKDWVPILYNNLKQLSGNTADAAIEILKDELKRDVNSKNIDWSMLSGNPAAIEIIKDELNKIDWSMLSGNTADAAIEILKEKKNINKIDWYMLSGNPAAIEILKDELKKDVNSKNINWSMLSGNPAAIELLKKHPEKINWRMLSGNPAAIELLLKHPEKINWRMLSGNPNPDAIKLIKFKLIEEFNLSVHDFFNLNPSNKICWEKLSGNPAAIKILKDELKRDVNSKRINWKKLSANPKAINLIKKKLEQEKKLSSNEYDDLLDSEKIDLFLLYTNPSIFNNSKGSSSRGSSSRGSSSRGSSSRGSSSSRRTS